MRTIPGYILQETGPDHLVMGEPDALGWQRIIRLNESAAFLWRSVAGQAFDVPFLSSLLQAEYGIDAVTALADARDIALAWLQAGIIEES